METEAILTVLGKAFACDRSCLGWSACKGVQKFELCGRKQRLAMVNELDRRFKECQETEEKVDK